VDFPINISVTRAGLAETDYDLMGELAPLRWTCDTCGARMNIEVFDNNTETYVKVSDEIKAEFIAEHTDCTGHNFCYKCHVVEVERPGYWCQPCEDAEEGTDSPPQYGEYIPF